MSLRESGFHKSKKALEGDVSSVSTAWLLRIERDSIEEG
jgi:hypothetical protein